jgi:hypothetical protein
MGSAARGVGPRFLDMPVDWPWVTPPPLEAAEAEDGMSTPHGDPAGDWGDEAGTPANDQPVHDVYHGLHLHRHSALGGPGGQVDGSHVHLHDHEGDASHVHDHLDHSATDYYDSNGIPVSPDPADLQYEQHGPGTSSSGRSPTSPEARRRFLNSFGEPRLRLTSSGPLSARLAEAEEDVEALTAERLRVEQALLDAEQQMDTRDVLAHRADLGALWKRIADGEQAAKSRMRRLEAEWATVASEFGLSAPEGRQGGIQDQPWERQDRAEGLSDLDRDRS